DFGARDVVAGGDDHVVGARLVPEVAVLIHRVCVAGEIPALLNIVLLALVRQIAAASRALHREAADDTRRRGITLFIEHTGAVPGYGFARGAGTDVFTRGRDEDVQHLGGADPIDENDPSLFLPQLPGGQGECFAGRHAFLEARDV